ncbi:hypothetical protein [Pedobacter montanisoli]|uniref:Uncharacterized protein n=1 Tax=Pedobacter montanisoli TaxID=2923277 RepID=A0ABS9ZX07_9SPHI|nr:hypothetical protein [Pedobacter montanisoli]MCJ0742848.1 hypothetical protein [Pedobacter montanisoli]
MNRVDENMEWKDEAPTLAQLPASNPYRVPDNYFDTLTEHIHNSIFIAELDKNSTGGFSAGKNFFEEQKQQILNQVSLLNQTTANTGFNVPKSYFDQLNSAILAKTANTNTSRPKTVKLWISVTKYAAAACVILIGSIFFYINQQSKIEKKKFLADTATERMLYDIDETAIIDHIHETQKTPVTQVSNTDVEKYILENFSANDITNNL